MTTTPAASTPSRPTSETTPSALERVPPQDLEAEMSLLGAMMLHRDNIADVLRVISPEQVDRFYRPDHRKIFQVLVAMYDRGDPIDLVTVRDELQRGGILEELGGVDYIAQLAESVPSYLHAEHYARMVRDKAMLRDLIGAAARITDQAYEHREEAREILDRAEQLLFQITSQRISNHATRIRESLEEIFRQIESREGEYITGLPTGFHELDGMLSGLQNGEMIIVAARPSMGKTAFGLNVAQYVAMDNRPVVFFSMEMSRQAVVQRVLCAHAQVDSHSLRRGRLSESDLQKLAAVCDELANLPMFVDDTPGMSVLELRSKARRLRARENIQAVFVDYLQLMHCPGSESRQQEVSEISRGLKALARELNIPVVVMSQLNRKPEDRGDNRPRMSDLRESGAIEQDSDVVMLLHREEYYKKDACPEELRNTAEIIIDKQRNGPTGVVKLFFDQRLTRFANYSPGYPGEETYTSRSQYTPPGALEEPAPF